MNSCRHGNVCYRFTFACVYSVRVYSLIVAYLRTLYCHCTFLLVMLHRGRCTQCTLHTTLGTNCPVLGAPVFSIQWILHEAKGQNNSWTLLQALNISCGFGVGLFMVLCSCIVHCFGSFCACLHCYTHATVAIVTILVTIIVTIISNRKSTIYEKACCVCLFCASVRVETLSSNLAKSEGKNLETLNPQSLKP